MPRPIPSSTRPGQRRHSTVASREPSPPSSWARWRARARRAVAARSLFAVCVAGGCSEGLGISTSEPVTGPGTVYAMASANEVTLPATFTIEAETIELRRGALTLGDDSTFIFSYAQRSGLTGSRLTDGTVTVRGQLKRSGTTLVLLQQQDTAFTGTYAATTVNLQVRRAAVTGERFVFVR